MNVLDGAGVVGIKEERRKKQKKEKTKEKSVGTWVEEKKRAEKKEEGKESPRVCVCGERKKIISQYFYNKS